MDDSTQTDIKGLIDSGDWEVFIARPFPFFIVPVWQYCYGEFISEINKEDFNFNDGIYLQEDNGIIRNYRRKRDLEKLKDILAKYVREDREYIKELFFKAKTLNNLAKKYLEEGYDFDGSVKDSIDFVCRATIFSAILPRFTSDGMEKNNIEDEEIQKLVDELRSETYYPQILSEIVYPVTERKLQSLGAEDPEEYRKSISLEEILSEDLSGVKDRLERFSKGEKFIYLVQDGNREMNWYESAEEYIDGKKEIQQSVKGQIAYPGVVKGKVHVCLTLDGSDVKDFQKGDILVSINSSPNLMHLIENAGALITDEGGITCHASIVSRELKTPCIIGTKNSTKVFKTGDQVEVDADNGIVKIIE
jgi:phosphohistidine swiveling domain-containing protein